MNYSKIEMEIIFGGFYEDYVTIGRVLVEYGLIE
jgi:hypothetical protein